MSLRAAAVYLGRELSVTRPEALKGLGGPARGSDMLLDGLLSNGLARRSKEGRYALTDAGLRFVAPEERPEG